MSRIIPGLFGALCLAGCASTAPGPAPYLAIYRPLEPRPGEIIVHSTAALSGRLGVEAGCFVVSAGSASTLVAFRDQVQVIYAQGRWGLLDTGQNLRIFEGEQIAAGGANAADPARFVADRITSGRPPSGCPRTLFISNSGFARR